MRTYKVAIQPASSMLSEFRSGFLQATAGGDAQPALVRFASYAELFRVFTPKRIELLGVLRQQGPLTVKGLAEAARRDYKNVHTDVQALERVDLIQRDATGRVRVPWDRIELPGIALDEAQEPQTNETFSRRSQWMPN